MESPFDTDHAGQALVPPRELLEHLQDALEDEGGAQVALMMIGLHRSDRLAALADDPVARSALFEVARRVRSVLRPSDLYSICSINEIWVVLDELSSSAVATLAATALRDNLSLPVVIKDGDELVRTTRLNPAIGFAWAECGAGIDVRALAQRANDARDGATRSDTRIVGAQVGHDDSAQLAQRRELENALRKALPSGELDVYLQPQIDLVSGHCLSAEALVRWTRPDGQRVNPQVIADICEEVGLMGELTRFVLNRSLAMMAEFDKSGIVVDIGVNLGALTLSDPEFPDMVEQSAQTWDILPSRLTFELTEGSIIRNERASIEFMHRLRDIGCALSIDDFGTGYSSLAYLRQFPVNELKIDRSFVTHLSTNRGDQQIVEATIKLAHSFNLRCVAEGVEDATAVRILRELGCALVQGYYYGHPMSAAEFSAWHDQHLARVMQEAMPTAGVLVP